MTEKLGNLEIRFINNFTYLLRSFTGLLDPLIRRLVGENDTKDVFVFVCIC